VLKYAAIRCALIVPSLCLIAILAFILSQAIPGDQAEVMMLQQGISPDSKRAEAEYIRNYKRLRLDLPIFYFSVTPQFYPENIHANPSRDERRLTSELLRVHFPILYISAYVAERKKVSDSLQTDRRCIILLFTGTEVRADFTSGSLS